MKKIRLPKCNGMTFSQGCEKYLEDCRLRNLREGTIRHYRQSYLQFKKFFGEDLLLTDFDEAKYQSYFLHLKATLTNDVSVNAYLRDLISTAHFWMRQEWIPCFEMKAIKVTHTNVETYTDEELMKLLTKPDLKSASFSEYQCWVITSFLFSTGVRQRSLENIQIKDIDFDNSVVYVNTTKNRKPLIVPMSPSLVSIMKEYLSLRQYQSKEEYLFCNVFGQQLCKSTSYHMLYWYNKNRGVETTGIHRYRHTFAKQWILNGGNVVSLSKILGHSSLQITQNYVNLLVSDLGKEVDEINLLQKYQQKGRKYLKIQSSKKSGL